MWNGVPLPWTGLNLCITVKSLTSPLLYSDMGQSEHGEEPLLILQLWRSVHLLRGEASAELGGRRRRAFRVRDRWRGAALPEHPPPLPPLLLHQLISPAHRGQAKHSQEVQFLCGEAKKIPQQLSAVFCHECLCVPPWRRAQKANVSEGVLPLWSHPI